MLKVKMVSRFWTYKETQGIIKVLRKSGLKVNKVSGIYRCLACSGDSDEPTLVFSAMKGTRGYYLVRHAETLFEKSGE